MRTRRIAALALSGALIGLTRTASTAGLANPLPSPPGGVRPLGPGGRAR